MTTQGKHYEPGMTGWVIRAESKSAGGRDIVTWWYGPLSGWGTTYGPLDYSVRVWRLRRQAVEAVQSIYGRPTRHDRRRPQKVEDAEAEQAARRAS